MLFLINFIPETQIIIQQQLDIRRLDYGYMEHDCDLDLCMGGVKVVEP